MIRIHSYELRPFIGIFFSIIMAGILICGVSSALSITEEWNGSYDIGIYTDLLTGEETPDGGYIFGGLAYDTSNATSLLLKTDRNGVEQWHHIYDGTEIKGVAALSDGYLFITSYSSGFLDDTLPPAEITGNSALVKVRNSGDVVWATGLNNIWASDLAVSSDGTIAVAGWTWTGTNSTDAYIGFFDGSGSETKKLEFPGLAAYSISPVPGGGWIAGGSNFPVSGVLTTEGAVIDGWAVQVNENARQVWYAELPYVEVMDVLPVSDGGYLLSGSMSSIIDFYGNTSLTTSAWIGKLDRSGEGLWNAELPGWQVADSAEITKGVYATAGQWGDYGQVQIVDENGNILAGQVWEDYLGNFNCIIPLSDGSFTVSGFQIPDRYAVGYATHISAPIETNTQSPSALFGGIGALLVICAAFLLLRRRA